MSPELRHLRYFVALAEELNFTRAAERLHVAQQTLSSTIQQLERELGVQLFERTTRRVQLTDAGRRLIEDAGGALGAVESAWRHARGDGDAAAELRVAYSHTIGPRCVPALHEATRRVLPDVRVTWWEMWASDIPQAVSSGTYAIGLARFPVIDADLECETVAEEEQGILVSSRHPYAGFDKLRLAELGHETFLVFPREMAPGYFDAIVRMLRTFGGFEPRLMVSPDAGDDGIIPAIYESGSALGLAPSSSGRLFAERSGGRIVLVALDQPAPLAPIDLVRRPVAPDPTVESLVRLVRMLGKRGQLA
ncbi:MAG TPA: LysR family transcriptional regulator [Thermoleophilaceae bacterium]